MGAVPMDMCLDKSQKKRGVRHFLAAFGYSMCGLRAALKETAIRHELAMGVIHIVAMVALHLPFSAKLLLSCLYGIVLIVELLNTAIEAVADLASPSRNELAKKAKDLGSAAVFCALVVFFASWVLVVMLMVM